MWKVNNVVLSIYELYKYIKQVFITHAFVVCMSVQLDMASWNVFVQSTEQVFVCFEQFVVLVDFYAVDLLGPHWLPSLPPGQVIWSSTHTSPLPHLRRQWQI